MREIGRISDYNWQLYKSKLSREFITFEFSKPPKAVQNAFQAVVS